MNLIELQQRHNDLQQQINKSVDNTYRFALVVLGIIVATLAFGIFYIELF